MCVRTVPKNMRTKQKEENSDNSHVANTEFKSFVNFLFYLVPLECYELGEFVSI